MSRCVPPSTKLITERKLSTVVDVGTHFIIRDGGATIGAGVATKIIE